MATMTPCCSAVLQNWRLMVSTGIRHHDERQQLEAVQGGVQPEVARKLTQTDGGRQQQQEGGEGKADEGGQGAADAGTVATDGKAELAGGRTRQQLAQGQQLGELPWFSQPSRWTKVR